MSPLPARPTLLEVDLDAAAHNVRAVREEEGKPVVGRLLVVHDPSDDTAPPCAPWGPRAPLPQLELRDLEIDTALGHGFLYRPLPEWLEPTLAWANGRETPAR